MNSEVIKTKKIVFLEYYRQLPILKLAAAKIGRNEDTVLLWKKEDSDFSDQVEVAKAEWALENAKKIKSREWLLERVMKNHFSLRAEFTGANGNDLPIPIIPILSGASIGISSKQDENSENIV